MVRLQPGEARGDGNTQNNRQPYHKHASAMNNFLVRETIGSRGVFLSLWFSPLYAKGMPMS